MSLITYMVTNPIIEAISVLHEHCINVETNEIYLHSSLSCDEEEGGIDYKSATKFLKNFHFLHHSNNKPIIVHMGIAGGDISSGFQIFDTIRSEDRTVIIGYAEVASMASVIFQAAKHRLLMPNSSMMIHGASVFVSQHVNAAKSSLKLLEKQENFMLGVYANRCIQGKFFKERGSTLTQVKTYLKRKMADHVDWYLDAEESHYYGFCDGIVGSKQFPRIKDIHKIFSKKKS